MGVAVLHPQDCIRSSQYSRKSLISPPPPKMKLPNPNPKPNRTPSNRQKRAPNHTRPVSTSDAKPQVNKLVIGQVQILKRGEQLTKTVPDLVLKTETAAEAFRPVKPQPEPLTERVGGNLYAGYSISVASPPPSSVPLPAFVSKKILAVSDATNDLRKMLRLELS